MVGMSPQQVYDSCLDLQPGEVRYFEFDWRFNLGILITIVRSLGSPPNNMSVNLRLENDKVRIERRLDTKKE